MTTKTAVVAGASGLIGRRIAEQLLVAGGWRVVGLARRPCVSRDMHLIAVDLNDTGMALIAYEQLPLHSVVRFTIHGAGEVVTVLGHAAYKLTKTGRGVDTDFIHLYRVKGGKISSFREFSDTAQVVAAYAP